MNAYYINSHWFQYLFYSNSDLLVYIIHLPKTVLATFIRKLCTTPVVKQIDGEIGGFENNII